MDHALRLDRVGRRYGARGPWILRDVGLDLPAGTLTRVEGANGTGKSTLLRLLARLDAPSEGRVEGRPRTAYVPERFPAALPFTPVGYLCHLGAIHGLSRAGAGKAAGEWLERFGAGGFARTPMGRLSKGSSQKVAVAQAFVAAPDLLVLDEAWTGLDTEARGELERAVAERTAAGGAVVFVDHDPRRLAGAADAVYEVRDGGVRRRAREEAVVPDGPCAVVEVRGAVGAELPREVLRRAVSVGSGEAGVRRIAVPVSHSDVVLRALLDARPPWHVESVRTEEGR
ncbi:ATP-binding cassette domain-containing protein [Streptomyces roseirectus]|uniref:ATP-binding cassette domain-containing protein n=1 Tax=Streptomyces roseirectus TaxID=2768066 RepID=A0A7H0I9V0_9ACTN|nr:ATP-binding cassette domain-containing protein [Streptomyces roseirectus]QNP69566.1 ATP-binding cassette domain-containing protein [Streptomyces roseirectus]